MRAFTLLFLAALCAAGAETVLVLENTPGMERWLNATTIPPLGPGDAMAIMTFSGKPKLRQPMTSNPAKLEQALRRILAGRIAPNIPGRKPARDARVYAAVEAAVRLLGANGGRIVLLFGSEEREGKPAPEDLRKMLAARHIRLDVTAVARAFPLPPAMREAQTPPTVRGPYPPVSMDSMPLPEKTLDVLGNLCRATGGELTTGVWNLRAVLAKSPVRG